MKARVKRPYFDGAGLHKIGDIVDVKEISPLVEAIGEPKKEVDEPQQAEKPKTKKSTKK